MPRNPDPSGADPVRVVRLRPRPGHDVDELLGLPLGLDVWERHDDHLVVAATDRQLAELTRRGLARVETP